jgi:hypothetical protein
VMMAAMTLCKDPEFMTSFAVVPNAIVDTNA